MFGKEECPVIGEPIFENKPSNDEYVSDHRETIRLQRSFGTAAERARRNMNAKLANPLAGYTQEELRQQGINFAITHQMGDEEDVVQGYGKERRAEEWSEMHHHSHN